MRQYFMKKVFRIMMVTFALLISLLPASAATACASAQNSAAKNAYVTNVTTEKKAEADCKNTVTAKTADGNKVVVKVENKNGTCNAASAAINQCASCGACNTADLTKCTNCGQDINANCNKADCAASKAADTTAAASKAKETAAASKAADTTAAAKANNAAANTTAATTKPAATKPAETTKAPAASNSTVQDIERQVVALVNQARKENGLSELKLNEELSNVARVKANDMAKNHYFDHNSPTYGSPFDMMKQFGISYRTAGENIAMGQTTAQQVFDGWMNSEGHRANILNPNFKEIGMGYTSNGNYWSQMFIG